MAKLGYLYFILTSICVCRTLGYTLGPSQQQVISTVLDTCRHFVAQYPDIVSFPDDHQYQQQQNQYWSSRQSDLIPSCRLTPSSTWHVSQVVQILNRKQIDFTVSSGKHATALTASNGDALVTLDLSKLSSIRLSTDGSIIEVGTGSRWSDVYEVLDPLGLTVAGGRAGSVGVGGFLLGGGISTSAAGRGWSCDTVVSAEVVLSNGTIVVTNSTHHRPLLSAIRGGGSNFGIVTRFDLQTFNLNTYQVGFVGYRWSRLDQILDTIANVTKAGEDHISGLEMSLTLNLDSGVPYAVVMMTRFGEILASPTLEPLLEIPYSNININYTSPQELSLEVDRNNPRGYRQHRGTLTLRNEPTTAFAIAEIFISMASQKHLKEDLDYRPGMLLQTISQAQFSSPTVGHNNLLGLEGEEDPLLLISFEVRWSSRPLDKRYIDLIDEALARCRSLAKRRGHLHPFVYVNYAAAEQDVWVNLEQKGRLKDVMKLRDQYDPDHFLRDHLKQPFLIPI